MEKLDALVLRALKERLFAPERLTLLLQGLIARHAREAADASFRLVALQTAADEAKARLHRLYQKTASGVLVLEGDEVLKKLIAAERAEAEKTREALRRARLQAAPASVLDAERVARFSRVMHERMDTADVNTKRA